MTTPSSPVHQPNPCDDEQVAVFLRQHPDFFLHHKDLLGELDVPHASGDAVSLVERQVSLLREQNQRLRRDMAGIVEVARENDRLFEHLQHFSLGLLRAASLDAMLESVYRDLRDDFQADQVRVCLFRDPETVAHQDRGEFADRQSAEPALGNLLRAARPVCGKPKPAQVEFLFGEEAHRIASAALIPLGPGGDAGLLAIGSTDPNRFRPEVGKLFLSYIGEALASALQRVGSA